MKKILIILSILLMVKTTCYSQVIINGDEPETGVPSLEDGDLDIRGNLKINNIQPTIYKVDNKTFQKTDLNRLFLNKDTKFIHSGQLLQGIIFSITYYVEIKNAGYNIARFNTKIPSDKYVAILGQYDLLLRKGDNGKNYKIKAPITGYQTVKEGYLFDFNGNWAFSVNYKNSEASTTSLWRVVLYVVKKDFVNFFSNKEGTPTTISYTQPEYKESIKGTGIGTDEPTEMLDVAKNMRLKTIREITNSPKIYDLMPIFVDEDGVLRSGGAEKLAYPVKLKVNLLGNDKDFLFYLRLGLNPEKYTPILADYNFICNDADKENFAIQFYGKDQPVLNNFIRIANTKGVADWELYMDYFQSRSIGCNNTSWEATLLVFDNTYIKNIHIDNNDREHPYILDQNNYDNTLKGYTGEAPENPNLSL